MTPMSRGSTLCSRLKSRNLINAKTFSSQSKKFDSRKFLSAARTSTEDGTNTPDPHQNGARDIKPAVRIVEVGARDGLQNESKMLLPVATKLEFIKRLAKTGIRQIELGSMVNPKLVPQMANTPELILSLATDQEIQSMTSLRLPTLIPNVRGMQDFLKVLQNASSHSPSTTALQEIAVFTSASEPFSMANTKKTIKESMLEIREICEIAHGAKNRIRAYVSCVLGCPYSIDTSMLLHGSGRPAAPFGAQTGVDPAKVKELSTALLSMGCYEVSLGDTIGTGTPGGVDELLGCLLGSIDASRLAVHFHDTYGQALANTLRALQHGIRSVDCSVAGLGGCPFAPGASGNMSTEDTIYMLNGMGWFSGVDLASTVDVGAWISEKLERSHSGSRVAQAIKSRKRQG